VGRPSACCADGARPRRDRGRPLRTARVGSPRPTLLIGLVVGGAGLLGLTAAVADTPYALWVPPLLAAGFGMSFTMPAATTAVTDSAPKEQVGLSSGVINAARQTGSVLGALVSHGRFLNGLRMSLSIAGAAFLAGAALTTLTVDRGAGRGAGR
jgi:MFS transporter, DHA2 family, methylenomycin A resistance protein